MRILAISGSLRASSTNTTLMRATMRLAPAGMTFTIYDGLGDLPHFSPDLDGDEAPPAVDRLRQLLQDLPDAGQFVQDRRKVQKHRRLCQ